MKGLMECQNCHEKILKQQRDQRELEEYQDESELDHTVALAAKIQHEKKMKEIDKNIIDQLDNGVNEQQALLALLIPWGFYETQDNKQILTQMHLVKFLIRLQKSLEKNGF